MKKLLLTVAACAAMTFSASAVEAGEANIYASGLKVSDKAIEFVLNATPANVKVIFKNANGVEVKTLDVADAQKGQNYVSLEGIFEDVTGISEGDKLTWEVVATAEAKEAWVGFSAKAAGLTEIPSAQLMQYPYSVTVNKNPSSSSFGNIYMLNSTVKSGSATLEQGVYAYNPLLAMLNENNNAYTGGISWLSNFGKSDSEYYANQPLSPYTIKSDEEGLLYLSDGTGNNGGVYLLDPENPTTAKTVINRPTSSWIYDICVLGTGENRVLYVLEETAKAIVKYEIGDLTNLPCTTGETFCDLSNTGLQHDGSRYMCPDKNGGLWIIQRNREETTTKGSFKLLHVNKDGVLTDFSKAEISTATTTADGTVLLDYYSSNGTYDTEYSSIYSRHMVGMDSNSDGSKLAIGVYAAVGVKDVTFNEDGSVASIKDADTYIAKGTSALNHATMSVAFDVADNLYVADWSDYFQAYAMPKADNEFKTPANDTVEVTNDTLTGVESTFIDENAPVEYYNLQGVKVENPANGIFVKKQAGKATKVIL